jgi:Tfp pilus assembly protein PilF
MRALEPSRAGLLLVLAVTAAIYAQTSAHEFLLFDDNLYVSENAAVQRGLGWEGVAWAFRTTWTGNWHPLTWLSLMLDEDLHGSWAGGFLLTNVGLHLANTALLFAALARLTGARGRSLFVTGLFALHPLHVESVAWVAERKDVLSGLFFMLALWTYARYAQAPHSWSRYGQLLGCFALGLLAKSMVVTLPFVLLLLDYWPLGRTAFAGARIERRRLAALCVEKLPLLAIGAATSIVAYAAQQSAGAAAAWESLPLAPRVGNACLAYAAYLWDAIWPTGLAVFYPHAGLGLPMGRALAAGIALAGATALCLAGGRRRGYLAVGWLWYLGMLVPVIGLVQVGAQARADRYTYLPSIGVFLMLCFGAAELAQQWGWSRRLRLSLATAALAALAVASFLQIGFWRTSETLFAHGVSVTRDNALLEYNLGSVQHLRGAEDEAIRHLSEAVRIEPGYADAHATLGMALLARGRSADARQHLRAAIEAEPRHLVARHQLEQLLMREERFDEAIDALSGTLRLFPQLTEPRYQLAVALRRRARRAEAIAQLTEVLRLDPGHADARELLHLVEGDR